MMRIVNLARRPFVNTRPVRRMSILLWLIGGALLVTNIWLYLDFWKSSAEIRGKLAGLNQEIRAEKDILAGLDQQLADLDLDDQNVQVMYLNRLIAYRTFPWSSLFDQLVDVLPSDVRLVTVRPEVRLGEDARLAALVRNNNENRRGRAADRRRRAVERAKEELSFNDEVVLNLNGVAKNDDALFAFVDALYESPAFRDPVLANESLDSVTKRIGFTLQTVYRISSNGVEEDEAGEDLLADSPEDADPENGWGDEEPEESSAAEAREARLLDEEDESESRLVDRTEEPEVDSERLRRLQDEETPATRSSLEDRLSNERNVRITEDAAKSRRPSPPNARQMIPQEEDEPTGDRIQRRPVQPGLTLPPGVVPPRAVPPRAVPPRTVPPSTRTAPPRSGIRTPIPVRPSASATPRLRGSLRPLPWLSGPNLETTEALS